MPGDRERIWFGNAGPNLASSFHVIGAIFDKVGSAPGGGMSVTTARNCHATVSHSLTSAANFEHTIETKVELGGVLAGRFLCLTGARMQLVLLGRVATSPPNAHALSSCAQVYRDGDLISPPARGIQTVLVPAGALGGTQLQLIPAALRHCMSNAIAAASLRAHACVRCGIDDINCQLHAAAAAHALNQRVPSELAHFQSAGGATMVEFSVPVPGALTLIDHAIFRTDKGAVGFLKASRPPPGSGILRQLLQLVPAVRLAAGAWNAAVGGPAAPPRHMMLLCRNFYPLLQVRPQGSDKRRDICESACAQWVGGKLAVWPPEPPCSAHRT